MQEIFVNENEFSFHSTHQPYYFQCFSNAGVIANRWLDLNFKGIIFLQEVQ